MVDLKLAKEILFEEDLNMVIVKEKVLKKSKGLGISPIFDTFRDNKEYFENASVADRIIGKAAAMYLVEGNISALYTDIISESALELLESRGVVVEYKKLVPNILNQSGDDLCPMEKISQDVTSIEDLTDKIQHFLDKNAAK